uniref:CIDE-N domain-containing protein n=1 Tax=Biomphalaria glabrata TaxID=6526 RepID=A0A2C9LFR2_BIOGL
MSETRQFKVWDHERKVKKGVVASSLEELRTKGCTKLHLDETCVHVVLEMDGTEIDDEDYFSFLPSDTVLMLLPEGCDWHSPDFYNKSEDHPDGTDEFHFECESEHKLDTILEKIEADITKCLLLNDTEMQQLIDAKPEELAPKLRKSISVVKSVQDFCQRHLDEKSELKEVAQLFKAYTEAENYISSQEHNSGPVKRKRFE